MTKQFAKGDRVTGPAHGSNASQPEDGAFAEYIMVKGDPAIKIPDNVHRMRRPLRSGIGITTVVGVPGRTSHASQTSHHCFTIPALSQVGFPRVEW